MTTFVFVHGGWHGGWCWDDIAAALRAKGHSTFTPTLTGLAERAHLIDAVQGPETHVADIVGLITFHGLRNVTLVGHSYGGLVMTGAASALGDRISRLVYVDAFVPTESNADPMDQMNPERAAEMAAAVASIKGSGIPASGFERWVSDSKAQDWLRSKVTPHPKACFGKGVTLHTDPFENKRKTFVLAAQHTPSPFHQFFKTYQQDPDWETHSLDCLHNIMIEQPQALLDILIN